MGRRAALVASTFMAVAIAFDPASAPAAVASASSALPRVATENGTWSTLTPPAPVPDARQAGAVAYDSDGEQMILFGGDGFGDTWSLNLSGPPIWTPINTAHSPGAREAGVLVYDSLRKRMILFGGNVGYGLNDVWALNLTGVPDWTQLTPSGPIPPGRMAAAGIYDPIRDRLLVFGGYPEEVTGTDVWALNLSDPPAWVQLSCSGGPPPRRWGLSGIYDPEQDRFTVLGGTESAIPGFVDAWSLSLADQHWTLLAPTGTAPPARFIGTAVYEHARQRVLLFGGYSTGPLADLWELGLTGSPTWTLLAPQGTIPAPRRNQMAVFDEARSRMVMFGGLTDVAGVVNDLWSLQFTPAQAPPEIDTFLPAGGPVGSLVTVSGHFLSGATLVQFNGAPASIISNSLVQLQAVVPAGATTGRIRVTTPSGTAESATDFFVASPPIVSGADPDSGKSRTVVAISGHNFVGATRVTFGGADAGSFSVTSDSLISARLGATAVTGPISVTTPAGTGTSSFGFQVLPLDPHPRLLSVRDVKGDQGGRVSLEWEASDLDEPTTAAITGYRVWRRAPASLAVSALGRAPAGSPRAAAAPGNRADVTDFWEPIADLPSAFLDGYAYTATTPFDSTADANPFTAFFVQALTADRATFYNSSVDSGYSVDNLAPPEPTPFVASFSSSSVSLHWRASRAPDFREFRLYRGMGPSFPLVPQNLILATQDTAYVDFSSGPNNFSYKLVAVDVHGNPSRAAMVSPETPVAALASLLSADADATHIRLEWYSGDATGALATVYRRQPDTDWQAMARIIADGTGILRYEDQAILPGQRYGYRLGFVDGDAQVFAGEVWLTAESPRLSMTAVWPNPASGGRFSVGFDLPTAEAASLELWDVAGRRIERREVGSLGSGHHQLEFGGDARLAPGVYLIRLTAAGRKLGARVVLLN